MAPELAIMGHHLGDVIENVWPPASQGDMPTLLAYCIGGGSSAGCMPRWKRGTVDLLVHV